jgi:glycolate oxidase FAD binding subunit
MPATGTLEAGFATIVGAGRVVTDEGARQAFAVDGVAPHFVVYPPGAEETASALRFAAEQGLGVIPCRNGTKLSIGNPPRKYDVALNVKELNRVWHYEPADLTVTVEPGMKFGDFQHFVSRHGLWLPLDPAGGAKASIGGIVATNSAGPLRFCYGAPRDMVLGLKIATSEGKIIKTGGRVVKNVTGYDLAKLLIGSYGTLGVIVEASFKLFPRPAELATFVLRPGTLGIAREIRRGVLASPLTPMRMALLNARGAALVRKGMALDSAPGGPEVWIEFGGSARVLDRCANELDQMGRGVGAAPQRVPEDAAETVWERIADFRAWLAASHPQLVAMKAALPDSASEEFLSLAEQMAENEKIPLASVSYMGVGTVRLALLERPSTAAVEGFLIRLRGSAENLRGALILEEAPAELKARVEVWGESGDDFEMMRKLKSVWDPKGILSPGRFVGQL